MKKLFFSAIAAFGLLVLPATSQAQYYTLGGSQLLTAVPATLAASGSTNFVIGTTNATIGPVSLAGIKNIGWELTCTGTNTSTLTVQWALFADQTATNWYTVATNATGNSLKTATFAVINGTSTLSTNYDTGAFQWMIPLSISDASGSSVTGLSLRYVVKPGF